MGTWTAYLGLDYPLPDRLLATPLRRLAAARRESHGEQDQAAVFLLDLAKAVRRRERPGEVDVSGLDADGKAAVTAELERCLTRARRERDSAWPRLLRLYDAWVHFARGW